MVSNILVELPWSILMGTIVFFCFYYPIGLYKNAEPSGAVAERGALMWLLILQFLLFASTFATMVVSAMDTAETAGNVGQLMFSLTLVFCGVLAGPSTFPHFWIFMYRVSPFTYLVDAMLSVGLANTQVVCAPNELLQFVPAMGQTCGQYMQEYIGYAGGYLVSNTSTTECSFCAIKSTNTFLALVNAHYGDRWRNFGILWVYIIFNIGAAVLLYWIFRMPKKSKGVKKAKKV